MPWLRACYNLAILSKLDLFKSDKALGLLFFKDDDFKAFLLEFLGPMRDPDLI